ncbi:hypothetical protein [Halobaculum limi]|uniref:hypothetical protein n=1 Tax=Halobaculum limi TaxID=3031916 RepID=UPI0024071F82|nr:hypothetical protein [Halobaculum sp. YSMS11]
MNVASGPPVGGGDERGPAAAVTVRSAGLAGLVALAWAATLAAERADVVAGTSAAAANHLLFAGVACTAIAAAVPKFVAVWSDAPLRWPRAARLAAPLVAAGAAGVALGLLTAHVTVLAAGGVTLAVGLWTLAAATLRTLLPVRPWDATERCLAAGTTALAVGSLAGVTLAAGRTTGTASAWGVTVVDLATAHATLVVIGGVLTVAYGGVFQLSAMLTGASETDAETRLQHAVSVVHPVAATALAGGRVVGMEAVALVGGLTVAAVACVVGGLVARRLWRGTESSAATRRYWGFAAGTPLWGGLAALTWVRAPLTRGGVLGGAVAEVVLWGAVGLLVVGSLYHVVPFLVWLDTYADRIGLEPVPAVEDLYVAGIERVDGWAFALGIGCLAVARGSGWASLGTVGVTLAGVAVVGFVANLAVVVHDHASWDLVGRTTARSAG